MLNSLLNPLIVSFHSYTKMSSTRTVLASLTLTLITLTSFISSQPLIHDTATHPDSPAASDCFTSLLNMSDCLTFVEQGSNLTQPDKPCCSELTALVETDPDCLCRLLVDAGSFGVRIDVNRALKLPDVCHVSTPPATLCSAVGGHDSASPAESPSGSSDTAEEPLTPPTFSNENGAYSFKHIAMLTGVASVLVHLIL